MPTHHEVELNGTTLHYVAEGDAGSPVLLVHGFPETWFAFHRLIPLLAAEHRVFAVDLRGFGESAAGDSDSATVAEDLHQLITHLDVGPVHVTVQDVAGPAVFRLAVEHPESVRSLAAIETGLPGYGMEGLADVTHGGAWYIGMLVGPGGLFLEGREREFLRLFGFTEEVVEEFARTYARPDGWLGAAGLYRSMLSEGAEIRSLAADPGLRVPVLAVGAGGGPFTANTLTAVSDDVTTVQLDGVGHYAALEAPERLAETLLGFF